MKKIAIGTMVALGTIGVLVFTLTNNPRESRSDPPSLPNPPSGMAPGASPPAGMAPAKTKPDKPKGGMKATPSSPSTPSKPKAKKDKKDKGDPADLDPSVILEKDDDPAGENPCADGPFSYEYSKAMPKPKIPRLVELFGPTYSCFLAAAHDLRMPGTVPGVKKRLEKMSTKRKARYWKKLELRIRRTVCNTFDYYLPTCRAVLKPKHKDYMDNMAIVKLLQMGARLHDISPVDRFHTHTLPSRHRYGPYYRRRKLKRASVTPPPSTTPVVVISRKRKPVRLCGRLKPCPSP